MMNSVLKTKILAIFLFGLVSILQPQIISGISLTGTNLTQLRKSLNEVIKEDFEWVKDYENKRSIARGGGTYWLVHLKPKRSGHYALKYSFRFTHKFSYPEEGENELLIRVGEKNCHRYNVDNLGLGNVCLGDTIIVPIQINDRTGHQFSLKSTYQDGENIGKTESLWTPQFTETEQVINQLDKNLKYLGTVRNVMPHRNYGAQTITYTAYFEAKEVGRFNLSVTTITDQEKIADTSKMNPLDALPIIIINSGTPVTAIVHRQNTINYGDNKRFSGHSGNQFLTKVLILQPGDVFSINYSSFVEGEVSEKEFGLPKNRFETVSNRKLIMYKLPFAVDKEWSYNDWIINYLPKEF
ncbi:MAG: hypothetical protein K1X72_02335 [Pyrinomonadaceae bacterium]|nr:hypothetical protein [Pyrinomonadaceae bacterium]